MLLTASTAAGVGGITNFVVRWWTQSTTPDIESPEPEVISLSESRIINMVTHNIVGPIKKFFSPSEDRRPNTLGIKLPSNSKIIMHTKQFQKKCEEYYKECNQNLEPFIDKDFMHLCGL